MMGDHGMTPDGNHGAASIHELNRYDLLFVAHTTQPITHPLDSVLFAYSPRKINFRYGGDASRLEDTKVAAVKQVDLVPTLSLLLGIPIPYCNLGKVCISKLHSLG